MRSAETRPDDLTTRARIRDTAMESFSRLGFAATTIRGLAADAGVSPALVIHHFGSKDGLRRECDAYVVTRFREIKQAAMAEGNLGDAAFAASSFQMAPPIARYLGWAMSRGHSAAGELFDEMVREGIAVSTAAIDRGLIAASADIERRVAVQMAMQLGMMVMHEHLARTLEIDVFSPAGLAALTPTMLEIFSGLFTPDTLDRIRAAYVAEATG